MDVRIADHELDPKTHLVALGGELDLYTAPALRQVLRTSTEAGKLVVVVDMTEATFIDSTILGVLIGARKRLRPEGGDVVVVAPERAIRRVFEITGLDRLFELHRTLSDALDCLGVVPVKRRRFATFRRAQTDLKAND